MGQTSYSLDAPHRLSRRAHVWTAVAVFIFGGLITTVYIEGISPMRPLAALAVSHALVGAFVSGVTALLMFGHARASHRRGYLMIGGTFAYVTLLMLLFPLYFTGSIIPDDEIWGNYQSASNLVYAWHFVLPIGMAVSAVIVYSDQRSHRRPSLTGRSILIGAALSALGALVAVGLVAADVFPAVSTSTGKSTAYADALDRALVVITLLATVVAVWCARNGSMIGRWLAAVNLLMFGVAVVRLRTPELYTLSWYAARIIWLVAICGLLIWLILSLLRVDRQNTQMAIMDSLTGSESRTSLLEAMHLELARIADSGGQLALLWIDLDGFKGINDQHGHQVGDQVLRGVVQRLSAHVRLGDRVGRLGGDEFGVLLCDDVDPARVVAVADRLLASIREPLRIGEDLLHVTAAIGVATAPNDASRAEDLLLCADLAMYAAKNRGGDRYEQFNASIGTEAIGKAQLRHDLANSLRQGEFCLYYQPIYEADGSRMAGVEVLARWLRNGSVVAAGEFVPFAEQSGQIVTLGRIIIALLKRDLPLWTDGSDEPFFVCVNLSAKELADETLMNDLLSGAFVSRAKQVVVEVTESLELQDNSEAEANLERLRLAGIRIAIDDFGAGFSNFTRLAHLRPSLLKVDRSLVSRAGSENDGGVAFLAAATSVAASLNCDVIAEGVETQAEAQVVELLGVKYVQGFHYAEPAPIGAFLADDRERA